MFCVKRKEDHCGTSTMRKSKARTKLGVFRRGLVEGKEVHDVLLETACSRMIVHQSLVSEDKIQNGDSIAI